MERRKWKETSGYQRRWHVESPCSAGVPSAKVIETARLRLCDDGISKRDNRAAVSTSSGDVRTHNVFTVDESVCNFAASDNSLSPVKVSREVKTSGPAVPSPLPSVPHPSKANPHVPPVIHPLIVHPPRTPLIVHPSRAPPIVLSLPDPPIVHPPRGPPIVHPSRAPPIVLSLPDPPIGHPPRGPPIVHPSRAPPIVLSLPDPPIGHPPRGPPIVHPPRGPPIVHPPRAPPIVHPSRGPPIHPPPVPRLSHATPTFSHMCAAGLSRRGMRVVAMDCEMVGCLEIHLPHTLQHRLTLGGGATLSTPMKPRSKKKKKPQFSELSVAGKCTVVDYSGVILFDEFINPEMKICNPRTKYSGIQRKDLYSAMPLREAQINISQLLDQAVLVGHAIKNDLDSLFLSHPKDAIRDTCRCLPLRRMAGLPEGQVPSLKKLTQSLLGQVIQVGPHSSLEDAMSTLHLYKLVEEDWEDSLIGTMDRTKAPVQEVAV